MTPACGQFRKCKTYRTLRGAPVCRTDSCGFPIQNLLRQIEYAMAFLVSKFDLLTPRTEMTFNAERALGLAEEAQHSMRYRGVLRGSPSTRDKPHSLGVLPTSDLRVSTPFVFAEPLLVLRHRCRMHPSREYVWSLPLNRTTVDRWVTAPSGVAERRAPRPIGKQGIRPVCLLRD